MEMNHNTKQSLVLEYVIYSINTTLLLLQLFYPQCFAWQAIEVSPVLVTHREKAFYATGYFVI